MYSLNGRALHEGHQGWRILRNGTQTQGGISNTLTKVNAPLRPGYVPGPYTFTEQLIVLVVRTPRERLEELLALCGEAHTLTRTADPTKMARIQVASASPSGDSPFDKAFDVTISIVAYDGVWVDTDFSVSGPTTIASSSQTVTMFAGIGAPIQDMLVFLRGSFGGFTLRDSHGSWLKSVLPWSGTSTTGLLFDGSTGQAFLANESDPFTPTADRTQYVDVSGNGGFRLTPELVSGNPADRRVSLLLTTTTQTNVTLRVRAKRSYRMN